MVQVVRYSSEQKVDWDSFVLTSKNGTFLFLRDYMEYHADRLTDHSLLFYRKGKLVALLPANESNTELLSHNGLSYGGLITGPFMKAAVMLEAFDALLQYLERKGFKKLIYKAIPSIYHQLPAEEDLYALHRAGATLIRRELNSVIHLQRPLLYSKLRKRKLKKVSVSDLCLGRSFDFATFMQLEQKLLQEKYKLSPVHTPEEITQLAQRFPDNIKLYAAHSNNEMVAGVLIYETATVAHCQYIGATNTGKQRNALDALFDHLLTEVYTDKLYFSFGISTEQQGQALNHNLVRNKESFGARTVVHDFYELHV